MQRLIGTAALMLVVSFVLVGRAREDEGNFDSNIQKLPNRYMYIDEKEGSRAVGVHSAGVVGALRKLYGAEALVQEITGAKGG